MNRISAQFFAQDKTVFASGLIPRAVSLFFTGLCGQHFACHVHHTLWLVGCGDELDCYGAGAGRGAASGCVDRILSITWRSRTHTRRVTMLCSVILFLAGAGCSAFAQNIWILIVGRILLGFGIGFATQVVPFYVSEVTPYKYRGALNMMFQLAINIGVFVATFLNYFVAKMKNGKC
ncbi:hypothetical protein PIB30_045658 [Stylosanthes scabra]|uniref:Major facilitator superfamily (MFS) profile domain-containing protein n=1 Tax=Stylosanthes scabra TaxID=79078 RepID=A0ABU6ZEY8_9FABA|nr:hypothetical protein [Stylosanthes scabra]